ncbi:MAG TPA: hypothetical protein VFW68_12200 [Rhodocyclaceae bacterium]|nr:hypothetical protein [Rhodocyclaceae bacterium]
MTAPCLEFAYRFEQGDAVVADYVVRLDRSTLALQEQALNPPPEWTRLEFQQCEHCPLSAERATHCPVALALARLVEFAGSLSSHAWLKVQVKISDRTIMAETTAQRAVSALMGLLMATSDCPHMVWLRPMARFHLPFASEEETLYRAASMYLLAQYFRHHRGMTSDCDLEGLRRVYEQLHEVNVAMAKRLSTAAAEDASVNAVILLDVLAKAMPDSIGTALEELEYLFQPYLADDLIGLDTPACH